MRPWLYQYDDLQLRVAKQLSLKLDSQAKNYLKGEIAMLNCRSPENPYHGEFNYYILQFDNFKFSQSLWELGVFYIGQKFIYFLSQICMIYNHLYNKMKVEKQSEQRQSFDIILQDLDRICKKQKSTRRNINEKIDQVIEVLVQTNSQIRQESLSNQQIVEKLQLMESQFKEQKPIKFICNQHKECFNYISKMGKNMERAFTKDLIHPAVVQFDEKPMLQLIQDHLVRDGQLEIHDLITEESGVGSELALREHFIKINELANKIEQRDLQPVIDWAQERKLWLMKIKSQLLFQLYRQQFVHLIKTKGRNDAIKFARQDENFKQFSTTNIHEISQLMTSLLFLEKINGTKYEGIYDEKNWDQLRQVFIQDSLKLIDQPKVSALKTIYSAGQLSMPKYLKYQQVTKKKMNIDEKNELPIEIELGNEYKFHSLFVCPVSREVCQPDNPPMLLKCGHVVSQQSIIKMRTNPQSQKFKCPTCPQLQKPNEPKELKFL